MLQPNFAPFPEINTERLLLRRITNDDAAELFFLRSSPDTMKYIDKERAASIDDAVTFINVIKDLLEKNDGITWAIALKENPAKLIGTIGHWRIIKQHYRAEVGYMLHPDYWRKGIMKEALLAVIDFGFNQMQLHSIEAHINPANKGSAAILESTGFVREAYFKEDFFFRGKFGDSAIYSLLNKTQ